MEQTNNSDHLRSVGKDILRETQKGGKPLFQIFKEQIIPQINYEDKRKPNTYTPPEAFEIAIASLDSNYVQNNFNFGIIVLYNTLELNPDNVVERLRPFLDSPDTKRALHDRLIAGSLAIAEDYLGLKRDALYTPFTDREWINS